MPIQVTPRVQTLLLVFTLLLTTFLSYLPQHTLLRPSSAYHPTWTTSHSVIFNFLVGCIYVSYLRAVVTDPGRPRPGWVPDGVDEVKKEKRDGDRDGDREGKLWGRSAGRWCKKCEAWKPPRCHHCRKCGRCVLRMDHHCPWTANCVGYRNLPHFLRFISYASVTTLYLEYHLIAILMHIWDLPSTSPSTPSFRTLIYILVTLLVNTLTTFSLNILTLRCLYSACLGTTTIEHWEQDRHASLVRRKVVRRVIFPWDIGIWENLCEAMGTWKAWEWLWVGAKTRQDWDPSQPSGWDWERDGGGGVRWEVNGFEDPSTPWPPPDPERETAPFKRHISDPASVTTALDDVEYVAAFRRRQQADLKRWQKTPEKEDYYDYPEGESALNDDSWKLKPASGSNWDGVWRNDDGETLADYGVDEEAEGGLDMQSATEFIAKGAGGIAYRTSRNLNPSRSSDDVLAGKVAQRSAAEDGNAGSTTGAEYDDDENVTLAELLRRRGGAGVVGGNDSIGRQ